MKNLNHKYTIGDKFFIFDEMSSSIHQVKIKEIFIKSKGEKIDIEYLLSDDNEIYNKSLSEEKINTYCSNTLKDLRKRFMIDILQAISYDISKIKGKIEYHENILYHLKEDLSKLKKQYQKNKNETVKKEIK